MAKITFRALAALVCVAAVASASMWTAALAADRAVPAAKATVGKGKGPASKAAAKAGKHAFVGAGKCKLCHLPYHKAWLETDHAKAFTLLKGDKKEDRDKNCLRCHTTGTGVGGYDPAKTTPDLKGVQCEACHGPGADYIKVMADLAKAKAAGLTYPVPESVCVGCHNKQSPTFKGFDFETYLAKGVHVVKTARKK